MSTNVQGALSPTLSPAPSRPMLSLHSRPPIPALTGLRFFAAFFILWQHSIRWIAQFQNTDVYSSFGFFGVPGMSLFFVLSGFVIHYNYRDLFLRRGMARALCEFAAARFARLYPLYLVFLLIAVAANTLVVVGRYAFPILVYYLTLTQSWWYAVYGGKSIINWVFPLSWSVSTEVFFYAAYPAVVFIIAGVVSGWRMIWITGLYACLVLVALTVSWIYLGDLLQFTEGWVSDYIGPDTSADDSFYRWFFYFSPYTRILEFFLGCMTAQAVIQLASHLPGAREHRWGICALAISLLSLLLISLIEAGIFQIPVLDGYVRHLENSFLCAPPIAVILFCSARYKSWFSRFLSLPSLVLLGEMSYSIYLAHTWTLRLFIHPERPLIWPQIVDVVLCITCGIVLTIFLSYGTYHLIEIPGRIWLRRSLGAAIDAAFGRTTTLAAKGSAVLQLAKAKRVSFSLCVALVLAIVSLSGQAVRSDRVVGYFHVLLHGKRPDIVVLSASYGLNCRTEPFKPPTGNSPALGNVSTKIRRLCRFSTICNLKLDVRWLGDPAPSCAKDFDVAYRCGDSAELVTGHVGAEASGNSIVLKCPESTINSGT